MVNQNFTGCIENFYLNSTNILSDLKEAEELGENLRYYKIGTKYTCPEPITRPVTFLTAGSYVKLDGIEGAATVNVSLEFRTYEERGIMVYHKFRSPGFFKVVHDFSF